MPFPSKAMSVSIASLWLEAGASGNGTSVASAFTISDTNVSIEPTQSTLTCSIALVGMDEY